jgi:2-keto-4-pentenoate hydratase/2-oxohepta-3-ene-1,7-dioic acid hydratase in catechol pathway
LKIECRVNGEVRQSSNTADMVFNCASLISYISKHFTLKPGDIAQGGRPPHLHHREAGRAAVHAGVRPPAPDKGADERGEAGKRGGVRPPAGPPARSIVPDGDPSADARLVGDDAGVGIRGEGDLARVPAPDVEMVEVDQPAQVLDPLRKGWCASSRCGPKRPSR